MRSKKPIWILILIACLTGIWWWQGQRADIHKSGSDSKDPSPAAGTETPGAKPTLVFPSEAGKETPDSFSNLEDLQAKLTSMPRSEAMAWINKFLASGRDKSTGQDFETAAGRRMKQWPTFRTFLIDFLNTLDPTEAARVSREILTNPTTADEWALALRNIGVADDSPETNTYLREKTEALIANPAWQANPSVGYLNAFDVLVHAKAVETTPLLSELIQRKDRKDLAHAAFLTLDRLVQQAPTEALTRIAADRALQQSRPEMAAQQFARADLRDPAQQALVRSWLLDPARSGTELTSFAGIYPNNNQFVSNNLLTTAAPQSGADLAAHDREALEIIKAWSTDPSFAPVKEHLGTMILRLNSFVTDPKPKEP